MVIWVVCGLFSAIGAYCYAELGTFIRSSGGDYAYVLEAFGPLMGFIRMWIECIIVRYVLLQASELSCPRAPDAVNVSNWWPFRPCTITAVAMTFATYILQPFFPHCGLPYLAPQLLAAGVIGKHNRLQAA